MRFGMDTQLGPVALDTDQGQFLNDPGAFWRPRRFSEATAREVDDAVRALLKRALDRALAVLRANRAQLDEGAEALLAHETLTGAEIPRPQPEGSLLPAA
jgi:cell division protease FtsH